MSATLDGNALPGVAYSTANTTTGNVNWSAPLTAGLGNHTLVVSAGHPSGAFTATATSNFTVATAQNVTNTHDGGGFVTQRAWAGAGNTTSVTDSLTWDAAGRLLAVSRRDGDSDGFDEQSIYDPLGRRVRVVYTPYNNGTAATTYATTLWNTPAAPGRVETTDSWFDPQVEFLEIATVQTSGNATSGVQWKVYGPDESGAYGGVQGVGGLEAVIGIGNASATPIVPNTISAVWSDVLGHVEAYTIPANISSGSATPGNVTPQSRSSGYGLLPGEAAVDRWSQTDATGTTTNLAASLAWQGRRMDASGYYSIGAREYNPVAGRFLSPDPLGQAASWDLYSYAGGDPINNIDCTGRSLVQAVQHKSLNPPDGDDAQVQALQSMIAKQSQQITTLLNDNPGSANYVLSTLTAAKAVSNGYKASSLIPGVEVVTSETSLGVGLNGVSSGIGAAGLVANFYGLTVGIANSDSGQIVSSAAGISLWSVMSIGTAGGVGVIADANPFVAAGSLVIAGGLYGYSKYETSQSNQETAQTIMQIGTYLQKNQATLNQLQQNPKPSGGGGG